MNLILNYSIETSLENQFIYLLDNNQKKHFYFLEDNLLCRYDIDQLKTSSYKFNKIDSYMGKQSSDILSQFLLKANNLYKFLMLEKIKNEKTFFLQVIKLMLHFSKSNYLSFQRGMLSYCSHSEGFFVQSNDNKSLKADFEQNYQKNKDILMNLLQQPTELMGIEDIVKYTKKIIKPKVISNEITFINLDNEINSGEGILMNSEYHKKLNTNKIFLEFMTTDIDFLSSRFLTILEYLFLKNMGITNLQRYYYCYLCYRTVEDFYSIKALEEIQKFE